MEQNDVKVSYLITTYNETDSLQALLNQLIPTLTTWDEIVIIDDNSDNETTLQILDNAEELENIKVFKHPLNNDFAAQKNFGIAQCKKDYIFQIDADELLDDNLLKKFKEILFINPESELFLIPRVNKVKGITIDHVAGWRWNISSLPTEVEDSTIDKSSREYALLRQFNLILSETENSIKHYTPIINWPDQQTRLYKRSAKIQWIGKVHERITGHMKYSQFPVSKAFAILHNKEIAKQESQNELYSKIGR